MTVSSEYKDSTELMQKMAARTNGTCLLAFSTGKDALCAWVELRKYFHTIIPVYYYLIPKLSFIERSLSYYEEFFKTKIIRLPNTNLYKMLNYQVYQTPSTIKIINAFALPMVNREQLLGYLKEDLGLDKECFVAIGNRMYDNLARYRSITKFGPVNQKNKTFYPVYDYKIADVLSSIKQAGVQLPVDYRLFGKTFDGLDYRFLKPIKEQYPEDFEKIKQFFPLVHLEIMRYEQL
jgi:hypothetical protein